MRVLTVFLVLAAVVAADPVTAVPEAEAKLAVKEFDAAYRKAKTIDEKQELIFNLHDVPSPYTVKRLAKLMRNSKPEIRNVAALALGGQGFDKHSAGDVLMKSFPKERKEVAVQTSILDAMAELKYYDYWPALKKSTGKEGRSAVVIRILLLLGSNKDYRAVPMLMEMFEVAMPKHVKWTTGVVNVDTGASGTADADAAKAAFNSKYGAGGSKAKAAATGKSRNFDARNFTTQIRACAKAITGEDFETDMDMQDWWVENYVDVARKIAVLNGLEGKKLDKAVRKAEKRLPSYKKEVEAARKKLEEQLEAEEEAARKKK